VTALTQPNAELAYRVLDHIDAHPEQWLQNVWIAKAECGTVGCVAGWTCLLSGDQPSTPDEDDDPEEETELVHVAWESDSRFIPARAAELLGIEFDDALWGYGGLFYAHNSREKLGVLVAEIFGPRPDGGDGGSTAGDPA
jgi:hypothetical protein